MSMKLHITPEKTLFEIQQEFQNLFPLLKIEFFKKPHLPGEGSAKKDLQNTSLKVADISKAKGEITMTGKMRASDIERRLSTDFGLFTQVFRKSGKVWIETITTDAMTLDEHQAAAQEAKKKYTLTSSDFSDRRD